MNMTAALRQLLTAALNLVRYIETGLKDTFIILLISPANQTILSGYWWFPEIQ
jgi:hypothetical protein